MNLISAVREVFRPLPKPRYDSKQVLKVTIDALEELLNVQQASILGTPRAKAVIEGYRALEYAKDALEGVLYVG